MKLIQVIYTFRKWLPALLFLYCKTAVNQQSNQLKFTTFENVRNKPEVGVSNCFTHQL